MTRDDAPERLPDPEGSGVTMSLAQYTAARHRLDLAYGIGLLDHRLYVQLIDALVLEHTPITVRPVNAWWRRP